MAAAPWSEFPRSSGSSSLLMAPHAAIAACRRPREALIFRNDARRTGANSPPEKLE
jgi:hypothetical protein